MKQKLIELVRKRDFSFDLFGVVSLLCRYILQISTNTSMACFDHDCSCVCVCSVKIDEVTVAHSRFCHLAIVVEHDDDDDEEREIERGKMINDVITF